MAVLFCCRQSNQTISKLGRYLRENLESLSKAELIPIKEELKHTRVYAEIEMVRFENIRVEYDITDTDFYMPALSIQPIVENAICHGVRIREEGIVRISTRLNDGYDVSASSALYDVTKDYTYSGRAETVRTDAGTTDMRLSASDFTNKNSNFNTVTFDVTDGYIKVEPINATVTITGHTNTVDYDGNAHSADGYDAQSSTDARYESTPALGHTFDSGTEVTLEDGQTAMQFECNRCHEHFTIINSIDEE